MPPGRISAYIYGNILVLAALIPVTKSQETVGIAIVVGAALSTFLAHVFAESVGQTLRLDRTLTRAERHGELRDSLPVLTSAVLSPVPSCGTALIGWLEPRTAQLIAEIGDDRPDRVDQLRDQPSPPREGHDRHPLGGVRPRRGRDDHRGHQGISDTLTGGSSSSTRDSGAAARSASADRSSGCACDCTSASTRAR